MSQLKSFSDSVLKVAIHYAFARTHGLAPIKTDEDSEELAVILAGLGVADPEDTPGGLKKMGAHPAQTFARSTELGTGR